MNKRSFKKKNKDNFYNLYYFKQYLEWLNLYKREKQMIRLQKQGRYKDRLFFIGITEYYIQWWKNKIN